MNIQKRIMNCKTSRKWDKFRILRMSAVLYSHLLRNSTLYCFSQIHKWIWSHVSLVLCTIHSHSQKTESAKNGKDSMSLAFLQSLRVQQVAPTVSPLGSVGASALKCRGLHRRPAPFTRGGKMVYLIRGTPKSVSFLGRGERNVVLIINFEKIYSNTEFLSTRRGLAALSKSDYK